MACTFDQAEALMSAAGKADVTLTTVGKFGGNCVKFGPHSENLSELTTLYKTSFATKFT